MRLLAVFIIILFYLHKIRKELGLVGQTDLCQSGFVCLIVLMLYVTVNSFTVMLDISCVQTVLSRG